MRKTNRTTMASMTTLALALACLFGSTDHASAATGPQTSNTIDYGYVDAMMPPLKAAQASNLLQAQATASVASVPREFARFRDEANASTYEQGIWKSVSGKPAFLEMKRYVQNRYNGLNVLSSFVQDGTRFDCIPVGQQPALRDGSIMATPPETNAVAQGSAVGPAATGGHCDAGSIPLERLGLEQLSRFSSLREFLSKDAAPQSAAASKVAPADSASAHHYSVTYADMNGAPVAGAGADLNIWNPAFATANDYMSINQIWLAGQSNTNQTQTLEVGWQRRPTYSNWGSKSILFIYSTQDSYVSTGCHNLECGQFVQITSTPVFGVAFAANRYSTTNGTQGMVKVAFERNTDGNWWLNVDGTWVGYYKAGLYSGDLARYSTTTNFSAGGETFAWGGGPSTPMGSGAFAAYGYRKAAFQANHFYIDSAYAAHPVTRLSSLAVTDPACYTMAVAGFSYYGVVSGVSAIAPAPEMTSGRGIYFGGPGCH